MDSELKVLKRIVKLKSKKTIENLKDEEVMFLKNVVKAFLKGQHHVKHFLISRLEFDNLYLRAFARARTVKRARKTLRAITSFSLMCICRWALKLLN